MKTTMKHWKERIARLMVAAFILQIGTGTSHAVLGPVAIPTGDIDLTVLASVSADITLARLVKWRTGVTNQVPQPVGAMTFAYLSGSNLALPTRTSPADNSANNQGDLWSDNAVEVNYRKGNSLATAILMYTDNTATGLDPLGNAGLRGGLVGGNGGPKDQTNPARASVIPLLWKALSAGDLAKVSTATVSGSQPIPANHPLYMPTEVTSPTGGACPAEGPYVATTRTTNNGFCDFSTHYFLDKNNSDPSNLWYAKYTAASELAKHNGAFDYASLVGPFGVNTTEQGAGAGQFNPLYAVLGTNLSNAIQTHYGTTIFVEVLSR